MAALVLVATIALAGSARAEKAPVGLDGVLNALKTSVIAPVEWDGIWDTVDTLYTCAGVYQSDGVSTDTICAGKDYSFNAPGSSVQLNCTGTATATTLDATCTGSFPVFTDCDANITIHIHGTVSGSSFFTVSEINVTYSGTGTGCDLLPPTCNQSNSHGTRTGPAPSLYCSTPTKRATWGSLKTRYR